MPDIYISRAGMETKALDEKFTQTELGTLRDDLVRFEQAAKVKDERIRQLEESMHALQKHMEAVSNILSIRPTIAQVESVLRSKQLWRIQERMCSIKG